MSVNDIGKALSAVFLQDKNTLDSHYSPKAYTINNYDPSLQFTARENECLFLLIRGKSAKEIGQFLGISARTVEVYIKQVKEKMNVSTRSQIIDKAIELNMLEIIPKNDVLISLCGNAKKWKDFFS